MFAVGYLWPREAELFTLHVGEPSSLASLFGPLLKMLRGGMGGARTGRVWEGL